jgi:hypothetical protein
MKPFNLEAAKRGEPIVCRDGTPAKFIAHVPEANDGRRLIVLISNFIFTHFENGREYPSDTDRDLFMAPKRRIVWVNLYGSSSIARYFSTEYEADQYPSWTDCISNINRIGNRAWPLEIQE